MAKYTTKRKYTKKPTSNKKVIKKITKKEVIEPVKSSLKTKTTIWQKIKNWFKGIAG